MYSEITYRYIANSNVPKKLKRLTKWREYILREKCQLAGYHAKGDFKSKKGKLLKEMNQHRTNATEYNVKLGLQNLARRTSAMCPREMFMMPKAFIHPLMV